MGGRPRWRSPPSYPYLFCYPSHYLDYPLVACVQIAVSTLARTPVSAMPSRSQRRRGARSAGTAASRAVRVRVTMRARGRARAGDRVRVRVRRLESRERGLLRLPVAVGARAAPAQVGGLGVWVRVTLAQS